MPWCPKCKTEYREGITVCADCKVELVAEYKDALLQDATEMLVKVDAEHRMFVQKLHDFLEYSKIPSVVLNEGDMVAVYVSPENYNQAKKCFKAFYSVETELISLQQAAETAFMKGEEFDYFGDDEVEEEESAKAVTTEYAYETVNLTQAALNDSDEAGDGEYTSAVTKYDDYHSSGVTFTVLGVLGVGFAMLNFIDVIDLFGNGFSCFVLLVIFGIFLALGIFSFSKADKLKEKAENEKKLVAEANEWMEQNFSRDMLVSVDDDEVSDSVKPKEILYMDCLDKLVERLLDAFPNLHDSLAEQLVEDFCNRSEN